MNVAEVYLKQRASFPALTDRPPAPDVNNVIVIPCHNEERVTDTLSSLLSCNAPLRPVEVFIVINSSKKDSGEVIRKNRETFSHLKQWAEKHNTGMISFLPFLCEGLPVKKAGVGLARKIGMDEAVRRFHLLQRPEGIITSLDADTLADPDYLTALEHFFEHHPEVSGVSVYFEHPLGGTTFPGAVYDAIIRYELHLRYFVNALRIIGYPFAYHTVGSAFAVRMAAYVRQGGMNTRQGGEDFYFLQKIIKEGHFADLTTTRVVPSPRPGSRVPFGTGPVIQKLTSGEEKEFMTYNPAAFRELALFFAMVPRINREKISPEKIFVRLPPSMQYFLGKDPFASRIHEILANVSSEKTFLKRFYHWFDTFRVIRYLNYSHEKFFGRKPVARAARQILKEAGVTSLPENNRDLLELYRKRDRTHG